MPVISRELTAKAIENLKPKPGTKETLYAVGGAACQGLYLRVSSTGKSITKSWMFRYTAPGTGQKGVPQVRREMSLGKYPAVDLKSARKKVLDIRTTIEQGIDPVDQREKLRVEALTEKARSITFKEVAQLYLDRKSKEWNSTKNTQRWSRLFESHLYSPLGDRRVNEITTEEIKEIIEPLWIDKYPTAKVFRAHIENVFDMAMVQINQQWANPARWKGHMELILPKVKKKGGNFAALPFTELPRFMEDLKSKEGIAARALEFTILCAARSGEVREATWDEIDLPNKLWTIPAERMKAKKAHKVPLSEAALSLLKSLPKIEGNNFIFPGMGAKNLSDMTLSKKIKDMHAANVEAEQPGYLDKNSGRIATVHGMRSCVVV